MFFISSTACFCSITSGFWRGRESHLLVTRSIWLLWKLNDVLEPAGSRLVHKDCLFVFFYFHFQMWCPGSREERMMKNKHELRFRSNSRKQNGVMEDYVFVFLFFFCCTRRLEGSTNKHWDSFRVVFYSKKTREESTEVVTTPKHVTATFVVCVFVFFNSACVRILLWWRNDVVMTPCVECLPFLVPTWGEGLRKFLVFWQKYLNCYT